MYTQLTLDLQLKDSFTFNNLVRGPNQLLIDWLQSPQLQDETQLYLWGAHNTGKSHIMQALCQQLTQQGKRVSYLPLSQLIDYSPEVFQGQEAMDVCCIDDLQLLQARPGWQETLFDLINRMREDQRQLVFSANQPPAELPIALKDLSSRLQWGAVFKLLPLNDAEKCQALQQRADARGFELAGNVAAYLLNNYNRDMADLFEMLDALDKAQLQQHRRLTIPFVKSVLARKQKENANAQK